MFGLPEAALLALELHRPAVEARRRFDAKRAAGVNPGVDEVLELVRLETGDEDAAQRAASDWMAALLRAGAGVG